MPPPESDRAEWLEQLIAATEAAMDRLRAEGSNQVGLLRELQALRDRLSGELGR